MKMKRIVLENFGIYKRQVFEFGGAPLVLIYGANESGKTTALNGLRQAIFGFRSKTPYLTGGTMSAEVVGELLSGQQLEFVRRKSRSDDVTGTLDGAKLTSGDISELLCNLDLESYEHLFGFSQEELRRGQDTLKSARLTEALAGGSLGGIHTLEKLRSELNDSLAELYKPRGSTSKINIKLKEIQAGNELVRKSEVLPAAVDDLRRDLQQAQRQSDEFRSEYEQLHLRRSDLKKRLEALPKYRASQAIRRQIADANIPPEITSTFVTHWNQLTNEQQTLLTSLNTEKDAYAREQSELELLGADIEFAVSESRIEQLGHQASEIPTHRKRIAELQQQIDESKISCTQLLEALQLDKMTDLVAAFSVSVPQRRQLEKLSEQFTSINNDMISTQTRLEAAREALQQPLSSGDSNPPPDNILELKSLTAQLVDQERNAHQKEQHLTQLQRDRGYQDLEESLTEILPPGTALDSAWTICPESKIVAYERRLQDAANETKRVRSNRDQLVAEWNQLQQEHANKNQNDAATLLNTVTKLSQQRDAILEQWLDELSQPLLAASIDSTQQSTRLVDLKRLAFESDRTYTLLLDAADSVAADTQLRKRMGSLSRQVDASTEQLNCMQSEQVNASEEWKAMWKDLPFEPLSAAEMLTWVQNFKKWRSETRQIQQILADLQTQQSEIRSIRSQLAACWPTNLRDDMASDVLTEQIRNWELHARDQAQHAARIKAAENSANEFSKRLQALEERRHELFAEYESWLSGVPVTKDWPIEKVTPLLDSLERLRREHQTHQRMLVQKTEAEAVIEQYQLAVESVAATQAEESSADRPEELARLWLTRLHDSRAQSKKRIQLKSTIQARSQRISETQARLNESETQLASLCATAGSKVASEVVALLARVQNVENLRSELAELSAALSTFSGDANLETFLQSLEAADEATLELDFKNCTERLQELDMARRQADESVGSLTQQIEQLAKGQEAQKNLQAVHSKRGELAELAEQWVLERLAQELLSRSIEQFANDHEPALLKLTRHYFSQLTAGRYVSVEHDKVNKGQFVVRNANEEAISPERMSTGTREQLYLALRMAFISHHCETLEPLPVVMDDCFVNFDDQRTHHTLEAIANWDHSIQTILLSCHSRVLRQVADIAPDTPVIMLEDSQRHTAREVLETGLFVA